MHSFLSPYCFFGGKDNLNLLAMLLVTEIYFLNLWAFFQFGKSTSTGECENRARAALIESSLVGVIVMSFMMKIGSKKRDGNVMDDGHCEGVNEARTENTATAFVCTSL